MRFNLRTDLEPWGCDSCSKLVYVGSAENKKFFCDECILSMGDQEIGSGEEENSEVILEEAV